MFLINVSILSGGSRYAEIERVKAEIKRAQERLAYLRSVEGGDGLEEELAMAEEEAARALWRGGEASLLSPPPPPATVVAPCPTTTMTRDFLSGTMESEEKEQTMGDEGDSRIHGAGTTTTSTSAGGGSDLEEIHPIRLLRRPVCLLDSFMCGICEERPCDVAFVPCGHDYACEVRYLPMVGAASTSTTTFHFPHVVRDA